MTASTPFVIAVTGHRDLHPDDCARVRAQLAQALDDIARARPEARLDCLSALAAGADQLFAEEVLALQERLGARRVRLLVPLPMQESAYIESQEQPGSQAFRDSYVALRARAQDVFEVPYDSGPATDAAPYVRLAEYLAERADFLLALWNGDTTATRQPGGTFDAVTRYLATPGHAVLHIPVRRADARGVAPSLIPVILTADGAGALHRNADANALSRYLTTPRTSTRAS
ncbi:hypothetical protein E4L96_00580 [Massilia arenosa]|uniref:Uncharacterized protein n=1 Tax=Zemynaea arenosa TaxID=2561931 RepID=A0A4Y9SZS9_9BURK|nr:hypothetical protein [Massilia arenosa]TFW30143.1 hypothetical protein E4L96_00580 [Massilia arenosa]